MTHVDLRLEGELTIYTAQDMRQRLSRTLASQDAAGIVRLDLRDITEADTAGIQLLLAALRQARDQGRELRLAGVSRSVDTAIELLGLEDAFAGARETPSGSGGADGDACADIQGGADDRAATPLA